MLEHFGTRDRDGGRTVGRSFSTLDLPRRQRQHAHVEALLSAADVLDDRPSRPCPRVVDRVVHDLAPPTTGGSRSTSTSPGPAAGLQHRRARPPVPPVRRHHRPLAGVGPTGPAPARRPRPRAPVWLLDDAVALFDASVREGWAVDAPTASSTPSTGPATCGTRAMHWVAAEATATAAALLRRPAMRRTPSWYGPGGSTSTTSSSTPNTAPGTTSCPRPTAQQPHLDGKPDTYHAYQATLIPRLPLARPWPPRSRGEPSSSERPTDLGVHALGTSIGFVKKSVGTDPGSGAGDAPPDGEGGDRSQSTPGVLPDLAERSALSAPEVDVGHMGLRSA